MEMSKWNLIAVIIYVDDIWLNVWFDLLILEDLCIR